MVLYNIVVGLSVVIALVFTGIVFFFGKGDAMSGGGGVRTTFKGKAGFDDYVSRLTLILGVAFMALMIILDIWNNQLPTSGT